MNVISPRILPNSLQADGHPSFSESRLPARQCSEKLQARLNEVLQKSLNGLGSTIYQTALKQHTTPLGRQIFRLRASARRTSGNDASSGPSICDLQAGWATAASRDHKDSAGMAAEGVNPDGTVRNRMDQLGRQVFLAGWATARANDGTGAAIPPGRQGGVALKTAATLAGWPTAIVNDATGSTHCYSAGDKTKPVLKLPGAALLAVGPARLTASGELLTGSCAEMESGGQLNPAFSLWLMGYPAAWVSCGARAMQSSRKQRSTSSAPSSAPSLKASKSRMSPWELLIQQTRLKIC